MEVHLKTADLLEECRPEVPQSSHLPSEHLEVLPHELLSCEVLGIEVPVARA